MDRGLRRRSKIVWSLSQSMNHTHLSDVFYQCCRSFVASFPGSHVPEREIEVVHAWLDPLLVPSGALDSLCHFMSCIVFWGMTADCFIATSCSCSCLLRHISSWSLLSSFCHCLCCLSMGQIPSTASGTTLIASTIDWSCSGWLRWDPEESSFDKACSSGVYLHICNAVMQPKS